MSPTACCTSPPMSRPSSPVASWSSMAGRRPNKETEALCSTNQLSLSRLNHRLPGRETHPEVMQRTAQFHHNIPDPLLPQTDPVFDDATPLDTTIDMLDPQPTLVQRLVGSVLLSRQLLAAGFLGRHEDLHLGERKRQEAQILQEPAPR